MYWKDFIVKKTAHLIEYAVLSILYFRALKESGLEKKNAAIVAIILCFLYGASDEIHQSFIPGREPRVRDTLIDAFGAGLAMLGIWKLLPTAPKKLKVWAEKLQIN
jgi:VanZ family protein